jgi:hypothetical protein
MNKWKILIIFSWVMISLFIWLNMYSVLFIKCWVTLLTISMSMCCLLGDEE